MAVPLLRLRSDEQLVALFRAGNDDAFGVLHERYRQRLFAYVRQMLSATSRQDAEDVLQDVFVRAFGALRADRREINVRAWLYRVAHNRCIDYLRRPVPAPSELFETSRKPLYDPMAEAQRREDLRRLVADIGRLPAQQRSALLMREIDGLSYSDLAAALDVTVPAIKSLLVRARVGLVEAAEARDADCAEIRSDLAAAYDRGVKASGRARRHMRECGACREYRSSLRGMRRSFAALSPAGGPLALAVGKLLGLGGGAAGGGAAAGGAAAAGSGAAAAAGTVTACKVAAVVCTAAITAAGGAAEVKHLTAPPPAHHPRSAEPTAPAARHAALHSAPASAPAPVATVHHAPAASRAQAPAKRQPTAHEINRAVVAPAGDQSASLPEPAVPGDGVDTSGSGGVLAPDEPVPADPAPQPDPSVTPSPDAAPTAQPAASPDTVSSPGSPAASGGTPPPPG